MPSGVPDPEINGGISDPGKDRSKDSTDKLYSILFYTFASADPNIPSSQRPNVSTSLHPNVPSSQNPSFFEPQPATIVELIKGH
jgi:hypothetical protein